MNIRPTQFSQNEILIGIERKGKIRTQHRIIVTHLPIDKIMLCVHYTR